MCFTAARRRPLEVPHKPCTLPFKYWPDATERPLSTMHLYIPATRCCRCRNTLIHARRGCLFSNMRSLSSGVKVLTLHQTNWSTPLKVAAFKHQCFTLDKQARLSGCSHQCTNVTQWSLIGRRRWMHGVVFMSILHERSHPRGLQHCWCSFDTLLSRSAVEWRNATGRARNEKTALVLNREIIERFRPVKDDEWTDMNFWLVVNTYLFYLA